MKLRNAIWFWAGIVFALTAYDGIVFSIHPRERYPEPLTAILVWMIGASFPAFLFYVTDRIISGMSPSRKMPPGHFSFLASGILYVAIFTITASFPAPYEKISSLFAIFLGPVVFCFLLRRHDSILSTSQKKKREGA
jgi:hypothetical protein